MRLNPTAAVNLTDRARGWSMEYMTFNALFPFVPGKLLAGAFRFSAYLEDDAGDGERRRWRWLEFIWQRWDYRLIRHNILTIHISCVLN